MTTSETHTAAHTAFEFPYVVSDNQLKTSALLNFILGTTALLAFISMRGSLKGVGGVYQRRRELQDLFLQPPQLVLGGLQQAWSWVSAVLCMSDADIVRTAGFDALLLNRTILLGLQIFTVLTLLSLGILLPTYYSFDDIVTHRLHRGTNVAELSRATISNLPPGHAILWLPTLATYFVTGYCCWVLMVHCQSYAEIRMAYMLCLDAAGAQPYQERKPRRTPRFRPHSAGSDAWRAAAPPPPPTGQGPVDPGPQGGYYPVRIGSVGGFNAHSSAGGVGSGPGVGLGCSGPLRPLARVPSAASVGNPEAVPLKAHRSMPAMQAAAGRASQTAQEASGGRLMPQPPYSRPSEATRMRANLSGSSLSHLAAQDSPRSASATGAGLDALRYATRSQTGGGGGLQPVHVPDLARMSYGAGGTAAGLVSVASAGSLPDASADGAGTVAGAGAGLALMAPHAAPHGSMPLRARLRLVAPWLRHVMVSAAERAARHKAADNLRAWVDPLKMLAKDREDWARQQLAADQDLDPSLPPVPSGRPPAATAAHGGLLVASEDMLMALTGRGDDLSDPRAGPHDWSDSVVALAQSLGIWLRRQGQGQDLGQGERQHRAEGEDRGQCSSGSAANKGHAHDGLSKEGSGGQDSEAKTEGSAPSHNTSRQDGNPKGGTHHPGKDVPKDPKDRGSNGFSALGLGLWLWPLRTTPASSAAAQAAAGASSAAGPSDSIRAPAVYRYWAPEAEQRCFGRDLRRRQRRHAAAVAATRSDPATPLGYDSVLNPVFERSAAALFAASAGGSTTDGGAGQLAAPAAVTTAQQQQQQQQQGVGGLGGLLEASCTGVQGRRGTVPGLAGSWLVRSVGGSAGSLTGSSGGGGGCPGPAPQKQPPTHSRLDSRAPAGGAAAAAAARTGPAGDSDVDNLGSWYTIPLNDDGNGGVAAGCGAHHRCNLQQQHQHLQHHQHRNVKDAINDDVKDSDGDDDCDDDDDDEDLADSGGRPWTGWQQQPLVVGRCNARLRQLLKVRHGGRCHLVNCHHYAVLVRDVMLHPVERFNALGMPVLRSSVEVPDPPPPLTTTGPTRGVGHGCGGRSDPRVGADVERGAPAGYTAGDAGPGDGRSPPVPGDKRPAPSGPSLDYNSAKGGRRGSAGGGLRSESGTSVGSSAAGDPEEQADGDDEHNPLLVGEGFGVASEGSGSEEENEGRGLLSPRQRKPRSRQRRHRPLLQPRSDLPLRDRAVHLVREIQLQQQHRQQQSQQLRGAAGEQGVGPSSGRASSTSSGGAAAAMAVSGANVGPAGAAGSPSSPRGPSEAQDPTRQAGVLGTTAGTIAPAAAEATGHSSNNGPGGLGCGVAPTETSPNDRGSAGGRAGGRAGGAGGGGGLAAAGPPGSGACVGLVPTPPPCMEVPVDDSEEAAAVAAYYMQLFPESFQRLVPVCNHRTVDELLFQWTAAMGHLAAALLAAHLAVRSATHLPSPQPAPAPSLTPALTPVSSLTPTPPATPGARRPSKPSPHLHLHHLHHLHQPHPGTASSPGNASGPGSGGGHPLPAPLDLPPLDSYQCAAIRRAAAQVRRLQDRIAVERARALRNPTRRAYIALFSSQRDAAAAAQCSPLAPPSRAQPLHFRACAAPPPDSVYWPALWTLPTGRAARLLMSAPLLLVLVFPIGVLTGALANLPVAVCGGTPELNRLYWPWFCSRQNSHSWSSRLAKSLLTGVLPALLSLGWNAWVLPMALYLLSAIQSRCVSLPAMDRQMSRWFFWWSLLNMFLGAVVGGGIFQQLGAYLQDPGKLLLRIGTALPTASNFFMHYTLTKGLYSNWLRVAWPHLGAMAGAILRGMAGAALPRSWQDVFLIHSPPGYRFSSFYNGIFQSLMVGLAYVVTAPLIAPIALLFFVTAYLTWRYAVVYVYERQYESGGQMFPVVFDHLCGYLLVAELFTGAVLLTNGGWLQAALLWASLTPAVVTFWRFCARRYLWPLEHPPMSLAMAAPPAAVDAAVYLPPALREGAAGWYPESGKVWEQYGIPKYVV